MSPATTVDVAGMPVAAADVVIIDAEAHIPVLVSSALGQRRGNLAIVAIPDDAQALAAVERLRPRLVILDLALPGVDSFELCAAIKRQPASPTIILLTARGEAVDRARAQLAGADHFLTKPFDPDELVDVAGAFLPPEGTEPAAARGVSPLEAVAAAAIQAYRDNAVLHRATRALNHSPDVGGVAHGLLREFERRGGAGLRGGVYLFDGDEANLVANFGKGAAEAFELFRWNSLFMIIQEVGVSGIFNDLQGDPRTAEATAELPFRSLLVLPLVDDAGTTFGLLCLVQEEDFSALDLRFGETLTSLASGAIQRARMLDQLRRWNVALEAEVAARTRELAEQNTRLAEAQAVMTRELELATVLQQSILPSQFPSNPAFEGHAQMLAARHVGGDFYDMFRLDKYRIAIAIADVSGKGVPAAFFMMRARSVLRDVAMTGLRPAECLRQVNNQLCEDNPLDLFVTLFYGILDTRTGQITYAIGGHDSPYLIHQGGEVEALPQMKGMLVGMMPGIDFEEGVRVLAPGETLFLYTDGLSEAMDPRDEQFGHERISQVLAQLHGAPPAELIQAVFSAVQWHAAGSPQSDDLTCLTVRYRVPSRSARG